MKNKIRKGRSYVNEDLGEEVEGMGREWNNMGWVRDGIRNGCRKRFGGFGDGKGEEVRIGSRVGG